MSSNPKIKKIDLIPYDTTLHVISSSDLDIVQGYLNSIGQSELKSFNGDYEAICVKNNDVIIIHYHDDPSIGLIVHESFHATEFCLQRVGIKHSDETSEAYAYLLQYIVSQQL